MEVHPIIDAYAVCEQLSGTDCAYMDNGVGRCYFFKRPYNSDIISIFYIALYENRVVYFVNNFAVEEMNELLEKLEYEFEMIRIKEDFGSTKFTVFMEPKKVIAFHKDIKIIMELVEFNIFEKTRNHQ